MTSLETDSLRGPHRFAVLLACAVVLLITAGGLVKSLEAGLSVPDWPTSYGGLNPPRWWEIENVRAEHGHRLIAGTVALLTVGLAVWLHLRERRSWVKRLAVLAVLAVLLQALLGGVTVLFFLPTAISVSHAALAEIFLCLVVTLAVVTSPNWRRGGEGPGERPGEGSGAGRPRIWLAPVLVGAVFVQILVGAVMRHTGAGLAIPDFPLAFGRLVPPELTFPIAVHYAHRVGAAVVTALVAGVIAQVLRRGWGVRGLRYPALALGLLVLAQITLGGLVVLSGRAVLPNTVHVGVGATILALSLVIALNSRRPAMRSAIAEPASGRLGEAAS